MDGEIDQRGNREQTSYDFAGRVSQGIRKDGSVNKINPVQVEGLYRPEATTNITSPPVASRLSEEIFSSFADGNGNVEVTQLDQAGQVISTLDQEGSSVSSVERNKDNLITSTVDGRGIKTEYTYDEQGNVLTIQDSLTLANNTGGNALIINGAATSSEPPLAKSATDTVESLLEDSGYETTIAEGIPQDIDQADPDGVGSLTSPVTSLTYDKSGNLVKTVDPRGHITQQEYDQKDRLSLVTDSLGEKTSYEYDHVGNVIAVTDAEGRRTENVYDSRDCAPRTSKADRLTETIDPLGNKTKYRYDLNDNLIAVRDALGHTTRSFYDSRDCAPRTSKADRLFRTSDAEGNITNYEYDAADNLIATVDGNGNRSEYEYDDLDRQVKQIDAVGGESTIVYDAVGNVIATTDQEGRTTELGYDERDRLTETTNAEDGVASFEYDDVGNLLATVDEENRRTSYSYDGLNRQIEVEDPLGNTNQASYDHGGNLISTTDGKGNIIHYAYDQLNRLSVVTNPFGDKISTRTTNLRRDKKRSWFAVCTRELRLFLLS